MTPNPNEPKPRGRPRKTPVAPVSQNPDEAVATKGYVKCLARIMVANSIHSHTEGGDLIVSLGLLSIVSVLISFMFSRSDISIIFGVIFLACGLAACGGDHTSLEIPKTPDAITRYEPPKPKKEC